MDFLLYVLLAIGVILLISMAVSFLVVAFLVVKFLTDLSKTRKNEQLVVSGAAMFLRGLEGIRRDFNRPN
jgi:hypothetical protein